MRLAIQVVVGVAIGSHKRSVSFASSFKPVCLDIEFRIAGIRLLIHMDLLMNEGACITLYRALIEIVAWKEDEVASCMGQAVFIYVSINTGNPPRHTATLFPVKPRLKVRV